uniref:Tudor domain-containing protein 1 n=1 Tax=Timema bartmani TaxID=61472 RepID=A0A7R9EZZ3_9NEOP|nr:unnamed protein product [Timema bartmani]
MSILRVRSLSRKLFNTGTQLPVVTYRSTKMLEKEIELDDDLSDLHFFAVENEDTIVVHSWTMASQPDNTAENKLKEAFDSWNPLEEDYEDPSFNTYHTGPGAYLNLNLQPFNKRSRDSGAQYKLFVGNIPRTITQKGFVNYFYSFGEPFDVALINNGQGTHNFGFISYKTEKEAELAIREVHRQPPLHLRVGFSRSEEEKTRLLKKSHEEEAILRAVNEIGPLERPVSSASFKYLCEVNKERVANVLFLSFKLVSRGRGKPPGYIPRRPGFQANKAWCLSEPIEGDWYRPTIGNSYNMSNRFILEELANNTGIVGNRRVGMGRAYLPKEEVPRNVFSHVGSHKLVKKIKKNGDVSYVHGCKIPVIRGLCSVCQKKTTLKCTRCGTWYCSSNCQIDHWPVHKAQCTAKSSFTPTNMMTGVTQDPQCAPLSRGRGKLLSSILEDARRSRSLESPTARKKGNSEQVLLDKSRADSEIKPHLTTGNSIVPKLSSNMKGSLQVVKCYGDHYIMQLTSEEDVSTEDAVLLTNLNDDMQQISIDEKFSPECGALVAVLSNENSSWCRGRIISVENEEYRVALVDLGLVEIVTTVEKLPDKYCNLQENVAMCRITRCSSTEQCIAQGSVLLFEVLSRDEQTASCLLKDNTHKEVCEGVMTVWRPLYEDVGLKTTPLSCGDIVTLSSFFDSKNLYVRSLKEEHVEGFFRIIQDVAGHCFYQAQSLDHIPRLGELVACQFAGDGNYYRALVVNTHQELFTVAFVDFGNQEEVSRGMMRSLSQELKQRPCYAVRVSLEGVLLKPLTTSAAKYLSELVGKETPLTLDYSLLLSEGAILVEEGEDNINVNQKLTDLLIPQWERDLVDNTDPTGGKVVMESSLRYVTLPVGSIIKFLVLSVLELEELTLMGCRADEDLIPHIFNTLSAQINMFCLRSGSKMYVPREKEVCLAKFSDDMWYRALCMTATINSTVVLFIDTGNMMRVPYTHVRCLPAEFAQVPALALMCTLKGVDQSLENKTKLTSALQVHNAYTARVVSQEDVTTYTLELTDMLPTFSTSAEKN